MSSLYKEAIADAKKLRSLAMKNAQEAIIESLEPKLQRLIDEQLLLEDDSLETPVKQRDDDENDVLLDLASPGEPGGKKVSLGTDEPAGVTLPDDEGKITLDLDDFVVSDEDNAEPEHPGIKNDEELALSAESVKLLAALLGEGAAGEQNPGLTGRVDVLEARCKASLAQKSPVRERIRGNLRDVKHTYFCVRESKQLTEGVKDTLGERLERLYSSLTEADKKMSKANYRRARIDEGDLEITLAGLPDDVEADELSVDVESADEDDFGGEDELEDVEGLEGSEEEDTDMDDDMTTELDEGDVEITLTGLPDDVEADELSVDVEPADEDDLGEPGEEDMGDMDMEMGGDELSDDDVVEIPESMLRQEIARARRRARSRHLNEDGPGGAPAAREFDDFGDASKEAEVFCDYDDGDLNQNESVRRTTRRARHLQRENRQLRRALTEANLFNAKMVYANKLLQKEGLSDRQKAQIVEHLDSARSMREVKLLYKGLVESLGSKGKSLRESRERRVRGSGSRPMRSGTANNRVLTEGDQHVARWGKLAGLTEGSKKGQA